MGVQLAKGLEEGTLAFDFSLSGADDERQARAAGGLDTDEWDEDEDQDFEGEGIMMNRLHDETDAHFSGRVKINGVLNTIINYRTLRSYFCRDSHEIFLGSTPEIFQRFMHRFQSTLRNPPGQTSSGRRKRSYCMFINYCMLIFHFYLNYSSFSCCPRPTGIYYQK